MKNPVIIFLAFLFCIQLPIRAQVNSSNSDKISWINMPSLNNQELLEDELKRREPGVAPRFAENIEVDINPESNGQWKVISNEVAVWTVGIKSSTAHSINLGFSRYFMPEGGELYIYTPSQNTNLRPFTPADNEEHEQLWTPIIEGDQIIIEVKVPLAYKELLQLQLSYVNHAFINFGNMLKSGSCNLDVICGAADGYPQVEAHRDIIQSVAVISTT